MTCKTALLVVPSRLLKTLEHLVLYTGYRYRETVCCSSLANSFTRGRAMPKKGKGQSGAVGPSGSDAVTHAKGQQKKKRGAETAKSHLLAADGQEAAASVERASKVRALPTIHGHQVDADERMLR